MWTLNRREFGLRLCPRRLGCGKFPRGGDNTLADAPPLPAPPGPPAPPPPGATSAGVKPLIGLLRFYSLMTPASDQSIGRLQSHLPPDHAPRGERRQFRIRRSSCPPPHNLQPVGGRVTFGFLGDQALCLCFQILHFWDFD